MGRITKGTNPSNLVRDYSYHWVDWRAIYGSCEQNLEILIKNPEDCRFELPDTVRVLPEGKRDKSIILHEYLTIKKNKYIIVLFQWA